MLKRKSRQKEKHSLRAIPIPLLKRNSRQKEKGKSVPLRAIPISLLKRNSSQKEKGSLRGVLSEVAKQKGSAGTSYFKRMPLPFYI